MNILVIGSLNMDMVMNVDRIPKMGETVYGSGFGTVCGGKGANQAVAAAKMGSDVKMIGSVGKDVFGEVLIRNLKENGVGTEGINIADTSSGVAVITVCGGDNNIILDKGANEFTNRLLIDKNDMLLHWADTVIMQFEIPYDAVVYAAKKAKSYGKKVLVNPAPIRNITRELAENTDMLIPNEHEAMGILGYEVNTDTADRAVKDLNNMGFKNVLITLGKHGCVYNSGNGVKRFGIYDTKPVDTTAAGDSFIAGLCSAVGEGKDIDEAVSFASAVSAIVVTRKGAATSIPSRAEVNEFLLTANDIYAEL